MLSQARLTEFDENLILFDGGENPKRWKTCGIPEGKVPDQYVKRCRGGGVNLHIYRLGDYNECYKYECKFHSDCSKTAACAGEQAEP